MVLYDVRHMTEEITRLTALGVNCCERVKDAVKFLSKIADPATAEAVLNTCESIDRLESDADRVMRSTMSKLFCEEPEVREVREVIKLNAIHEPLETITDKCEDVANFIECIVLENSWTAGVSHGFHDAANLLATAVSTGVLKPGQTVVFAAFFNLVASLSFTSAWRQPSARASCSRAWVNVHVVFGALIGAISWNLVTWSTGTTASRAARPTRCSATSGALVAPGIWTTVAFISVTPLRGFLFGSFMMILVARVFQRATPWRVDRWFRSLQLVSAGAYSQGHGGNDVQNTIGIAWMLLIATGHATADSALPPTWTIVTCYTAISLRTMFGDWRIVRTVSQKIPSSTTWAASAPRRAGRSRCSS